MQRMRNEFYNAEIINESVNDIECKYNAILSAPLLENPENYNVAVNRFRVPITSIPLTKNNIPFKKWQVQLGYNDNNLWNYNNQYVPQLNEKNDGTNAYMFVNTSTGYKFVRDAMNNNSCTRVQSIDFTYPSNEYPLSSSNSKFIAVSFVGKSVLGKTNVYIFDHRANLISTIQENSDSKSCLRIYMDVNNNLFVGYQTPSGFSCFKYDYSTDNTWTYNMEFYSYNTIISDPQDIFYDNSTSIFYVTSQNRLYFWTSQNEVTGSIPYTQNTSLQASKITKAFGSLYVSFEPKPFYEDQLYYVKTNFIYSIDDVKQTVGSIIKSPVVINTSSSTKYMFGIYSDNKLVAQLFPLDPLTVTWYPAEMTTNLSMIFSDSTNTNLYAIDTSYNLLAFNLSNNSNYWTNIGSNFKISSFETLSTVDSCQSNKLICSSSNNNLKKTNYPLVQRAFVVSKQNGSSLQLMGINNNNGTLNKVVLNENIPLNTPISNFKSMCFNGTSYFVANTSGTVDKYNSKFVYQATYPFTECGGSIGYMHYGTKSGYIYAGQFMNYNNNIISIKVYNTSGVFQGTLLQQQGAYNLFFEIPYASYPVLVAFINNTCSLYNVSNLASPTTILSFTTSTTVLDLCYNATNTSLYLLEGSYTMTNSLTNQLYLNGSQVEKIQLNATLTSVTSQTMIIENQTGITSLNFASNSQELYLTYASTQLIQIYSIINSSVYGTVSMPTGITSENLACLLPLSQYTASYLTWNNIGGNGVGSISASRNNENVLYCTNYNTVFYGNLYNNNVNWVTLHNSSPTYSYISCYGDLKQSSSNVQITSYANNTLYFQLTIPYTGLNFLGTTSDNLGNQTFLCGPKNANTIYQIFNLIAITIPSVTNIYSLTGTMYDTIESGKCDIFYYDEFLSKINVALKLAYDNMKSSYGDTFAPTEAPRVIFNPSDKLFALVCQNAYLDDTKYKISMNDELWDKFLFKSTLDNGYRKINLSNDVYNSSTLYNLTYQQTSTMFKFFDLVRIMVTTNMKIDSEMQGSNGADSLLVDISPDTTINNNQDIEIYNPQILRFVNLLESSPLRIMNMQFQYQFKDGSIYPLILKPNQYCSIKLQFQQTL
jgi:hypothetical protein